MRERGGREREKEEREKGREGVREGRKLVCARTNDDSVISQDYR